MSCTLHLVHIFIYTLHNETFLNRALAEASLLVMTDSNVLPVSKEMLFQSKVRTNSSLTGVTSRVSHSSLLRKVTDLAIELTP